MVSDTWYRSRSRMNSSYQRSMERSPMSRWSCPASYIETSSMRGPALDGSCLSANVQI